MRLVTYSVGPAGPARAGVRVGHRILDIETASRVKGEPLPASIKALLAAGRGAMSRVQALAKAATSGAGPFSHALHEERAVRLLPPVQDGGLVGHDARIAWPKGVACPGCLPRLAFVIGRRGQGVTKEGALDYVAGVTLLIDLAGGAAPGPGADSQAALAAAKRLPGLGALGPEIVTMDEIADLGELWLTCSVNGAERLRASTHGQVEELPGILEEASRGTDLEPGDVFPTGAGAARQVLGPGDAVECSIEGIATLRTTIGAPGEA